MSDSDLENSPVSTKRARESSFGSETEEEPEQLAPPPLRDPKEQVQLITLLQQRYLKPGETWYLISQVWFKRWNQYCSRLGSEQEDSRKIGERTNPGPINNNSILDDQEKLVKNLIHNETVFAVPSLAWQNLVEWYGDNNSGPITRKVITTMNGVLAIEMYPPQFRLYAIEDDFKVLQCPIINLSETNLIQDFTLAVKQEFNFPLDTEIQAWILKQEPSSINISINDLIGAFRFELDDENAHLSRSGEFNIGIEIKDKIEGKYPSELISMNTDSSSVSSNSSILFANGFNSLTTTTPPPPTTTKTANTPPPEPTCGVVGLQNLGNTCFMNSALQCLSNTPQLTKYFLANLYKIDLNPDNPLGMKGQVAEAYGELIENLWSGHGYSSLPPRNFKYTIGRFNSSFSGYQQHDTQELLGFLLDGLHEDLNRIIKKPYIELPDFDGMKDVEIATCSWDYHKARNDSVIVDLFQGQFKSRLICEECKNVSVTFDPFMYLSLPLPIKKKSKTTIVYVPYDPSQRLQRIVVTLSKEASIAHLQKEVAKMMSVEDPNSLLVVEIFTHKIYKVYPQYEPVAQIGSSDTIYVYQLPGPVPPIPKKKVKFSYYNRQEPEEEKALVDENQLIVFPVYCATVEKSNDRITQFGEPIILAVPYKDANKPELLYRLVSQHIERYTNIKLFQEINDPFMAEEDEYKTLDSEQEDAYKTMDSDQDDAYKRIDSEHEDALQPPSYDAITTDNMEIDSLPVHQQPIHTAAAVTAAGGKRVEPMSNLFSMKVFSSSRSYGPDELLPTNVQSLTGLVDLYERAESEQQQLQEYLRQENELSSSDEEADAEMQEPIDLPSKVMEEEETVQDAAALFATSLEDGEIKEEDDRDSIGNTSYPSDNDSDGNFRTNHAQPAPPVLVMPQAPAPIKRKVPCPPSTIIRQGEGILLAWTPKKAQQLFGTCRHGSGVCTEAWDDMNELGDPNQDMQQQDQSKKKQVTLSDCLDEFTKEEELSEEDLWYCPKCKQHQRATKKFDLWRMPDIMVVHLKRFSHSRTWRDKIDALIDFPTSSGLDLTDRVLSIEDHTTVKDEDRLIYDLYGVDNHYGGLGGGHYTSFAQNFEDQQWYNFDDSHVTKVDVSDIKTSAAYLLFYKRRRPLNNAFVTRSVQEIIQEAKEKQQAAHNQAEAQAGEKNLVIFVPPPPPLDDDDDTPPGYVDEPSTVWTQSADEPLTEWIQPPDKPITEWMQPTAQDEDDYTEEKVTFADNMNSRSLSEDLL